MKINFDTDYQTGAVSHGDKIHNEKVTPQSIKSADAASAGGFLVSMGMGADLPAMSNDKAPVTDLAANIGETDVQLKTDYMSVMSLSMSDEDYAELVRTGQAPEDMDATDSVTILDDIKAALIRGGADIAGYTDTIDAETLEDITGSEAAAAELMKKIADVGLNADALANNLRSQDLSITADNINRITDAVSLAKEALPLTDTAAAYLVANSKSPTIENIYQASHAGNADANGGRRFYSEDGYVGRMAESDDIDSLRPQIEDTIRRSGLEVNDDTYNDAKLLIGHNIPLTPETLLQLNDLRVLRGDVSSDDIADSVSIAMSAGVAPSKANLTYDTSIYTRAEELVETVGALNDAAADIVSADGQILNISNLLAASEKADTVADISGLSAEQLHSRRVLEEVRITMTVEANRMLLRSNFQIDIAPMEELVDALKQAEEAIAGRLFPSDDKAVTNSRMELYAQTKTELAEIPTMPAAILGQYRAAGTLQFGAGESFTLHEVYESGSTRRDMYIRAEESYETLMTAPRADMGDSIRKAFANVDDILSDLRVEINDVNRRAVRILGYNSTEITVESIEQVREADMGLRNVIERLTPERVLNMIREDVNPLSMSIQELGDYLDGQDDDPERKASDYARFLMQLERQNEITELERDSYIGIYRMISKLDRTDDAAVGKLVEMGSQMSFSGLLAAMRSTARAGMDYRVGDDFGGVDSLRDGVAIDEQINAAFGIERFAESARSSESVIENLILSGQGVSVSNVEAMRLLKERRGDWYKPISAPAAQISEDGDKSEAQGMDAINSAVDSVLGAMTDRESTYESYMSMLDNIKTEIADRATEAGTYLDVRAMQVSMKQINILSSLARDEVYDLPADIDGEMTSIRLTIRRESGAGRVAVSVTTISIGIVAAEFSMKGTPSGYIAYERMSARDRLSEMLDSLTDALGFEPALIQADRINLDRYTDGFFDEKNKNEIKDGADVSDINNTELYRVAKTFINALRNI